MKKFFKGKAIGYHTSVTLSKGEQVVVWIVALIFFCCFIANFFLFKSVFLIVLLAFLEFGIMFAIYFAILFRPKHKEEREKNTVITK